MTNPASPPIERPEQQPSLRLIRHHLGQAALNILIHPDDAPAIHRELDQAARRAQEYASQPKHEQDLELLAAIIAEGRALRSIQDEQVPSSYQNNPGPPETGPLDWRPTPDRCGSTATRGHTVYVVHAAGRKPVWRCGIGDGISTEWFDRRFDDAEAACAAAQRHCDESDPTSNTPS